MKGAIVYISSNKEKPEFETRVIKDIKSKTKLPIYAVTQKKMKILKNDINVYVGDVGTSGFNFCRQLQIAVKLARTGGADYVISCESDCLYSPDYFEFKPKRGKIYRNTNIYLLPYKKDYWHKKNSQTAFQVSDARVFLKRLDWLMGGQPRWNTEMKNFPKEIGLPFLKEWDTFKTKHPCFGIKTGRGMRKHSASGRKKFYELPYWGTVKQVREKYEYD